MNARARNVFRSVFGAGLLGLAVLVAESASAKYAAVIMDARSGRILHSENGNAKLHPASLTKMMTVYVAIQAVENGEINLDSKVRISKFAASEPPSKINLRAGSRVRLRHLIRAAAVRSANDAATAIAEAISGSESAFAARMNRTARAMGMTKTSFKNAHGLTQSGHMSTARDMSVLGRHVIYNYPEYYHLFSKITADVGGGTTVRNTNRRFLRAVEGADGIKTGFTNSAGFNLTASAKRGDKRIIVTVFGGRSTKTRDAHVAELIERGFRAVATQTALRPPPRPQIPFGSVSRVDTTVESAKKRQMRPEAAAQPAAAAAQPSTADAAQPAAAAQSSFAAADQIIDSIAGGIGEGDADPAHSIAAGAPLYAALPIGRPARRSGDPASAAVVSDFNGIRLGRFATRASADRHLSQAVVMAFESLVLAEKRIELKNGAYVGGFVNMSPDGASRACAKLNSRDVECELTRSE